MYIYNWLSVSIGLKMGVSVFPQMFLVLYFVKSCSLRVEIKGKE